MISLGYKQSQGDHTLFVRHLNFGRVTALLVYANDIIITGKTSCKLVETPIKFNHILCDAPEDRMVDRGSYQRLVGMLIYLAHTRPDIAFTVSMVGQFMHNPK
ncbi:Copia protein [Gossypium australe]|uniref:Copia protein n=1 Tax=Gossypium australe TaxID=47621 RepID=A0A5B6U5C7_9ROSI|nr:Copia protein [Gossypium australe]